MGRINLLIDYLNKHNMDYFITYMDQIPARYFFSKYIKSDVHSLALKKDGEIIFNPSRELFKGKKTGFYLNDLPYKRVSFLTQKYNLTDVSGFIDKLRVVKTPTEIEKIRKACKITMNVFKEISSLFEKRMSERFLAIEVKRIIISQYADIAFEPIVAFNHHTSYVHHIPSEYSPSTKKIILMDLGGRFKYYNSDVTQTFIFSSVYEKVFEDVKNTLTFLANEIKSSTSLAFVNKMANDLLSQYGKSSFKHYHLLGHGVGLEVHELPNFSKNTILEKNMVITLEPAVYFKNNYGIRLEKTYVIKKKKAKSLC